jgi:hypothetical protein
MMHSGHHLIGVNTDYVHTSAYPFSGKLPTSHAVLLVLPLICFHGFSYWSVAAKAAED